MIGILRILGQVPNWMKLELYKRQTSLAYANRWQRVHLDKPLFISLMALTAISMIILYSADNGSFSLIYRQTFRVVLGLIALFVCSQLNPEFYKKYTPLLFYFTILLLLSVILVGKMGKGAQRWIDLGFIKLQPSELAKYSTAMMIAWYINRHEIPPTMKQLMACGMLIFVPFIITAKQPDLGTAILILISGLSIIYLAGLRLRVILLGLLTVAISSPIIWHFLLHAYQKRRILTFLYPERDPFGSGYHIIQSKIAIGSGGLWGKGWLNGSQAHLNYLPEHATDFIFSLGAEEFGLMGCLLVILIYGFIVLRCLYLSQIVSDNYRKLVIGGLAMIIFFSAYINIGMVMGILPVVGIPLPIISYGGSSLLSTFAAFGIIMSLATHRD